MNLFENKKLQKRTIVVAVLLFILPFMFYILEFISKPISDKSADWASFGDFIGGTVGTYLGLLNLIVLVIITIQVAKFSEKEALKQQFIIKRMEAYQILSDFVPKFNMLPHKVSNEVNYLRAMTNSMLEQRDNGRDISHDARDLLNWHVNLRRHYDVLMELHYCIFNFKVRYGHLFQYSFESEDFKKLLAASNENLEFYIKIQNSIQDNKGVDDMPNGDFIGELTKFLNALREEIPMPK